MQSLDAAIISLMDADKEAKKREEGATHGEKQSRGPGERETEQFLCDL